MPLTLVVEDDPTIAEVVTYQLEKAGHEVVATRDGAEALELARTRSFDLIVLDLMLPSISGIDILRLVRAESNVPVVVISARDADADQVMALELGADDYLTKPFSIRHLLARIAAVLRRSAPSPVAPRADLDDYALVIDEGRHEVRKRGELVALPPRVFEVLCFLARNQNRACSRHELLEEVWGYEYEGQTRTLDVHIHWLRQRIEDDPTDPKFVLTVRQHGYRFQPTPADGHDRAIFLSIEAETPPVPPAIGRHDLITRGSRVHVRT